MSKRKFLGVEEPDFSEVGDALAELVRDRIRSAPGNRWNKTGLLLHSISSADSKHGVSVTASSDRLQRDEVARLFADEILPDDLDSDTRDAIAEAIFNTFKVSK